jgi:hypothetical protein
MSSRHRYIASLVLCGFFNFLWAAESPTAGVPASLGAIPSIQPRRTFEHNGHVYVLVLSNATEEVDTEEYVMEGETLDQWTQLISYQRVRLPSAIGADQYVASLQHYFDQNKSAAHSKVVQQGKTATVFGVQYDKTTDQDLQLTIALAFFPSAKDPTLLHLIQFTLKPAKVTAAEIENLIRSWQGRFQSEASSISK